MFLLLHSKILYNRATATLFPGRFYQMQRLEKIDAHKLEAEKFENRIESHHSENNSSIESVMQKVVEDYESNKSSVH